MKKSDILELNEKTMLKYDTYENWAKKHLRFDNEKDWFKEAFIKAHKNAEKAV